MKTDIGVSVVVGMVDRLTKPMRNATRPVETLTDGIAKATQALDKLGKQKSSIKKFVDLKKKSVETTKELERARKKTGELGKELKASEKPTKAMSDAFDKARARVNALKEAQEAEQRQLQSLRRELRQSGTSTDNLSRDQRELKRATGDATKALDRQKGALERIQRQQKRMADARDKFDGRMQRVAGMNQAGEAAGRVAGSVRRVLGGLVGTAVTFEDAMGGVGKVVDFDEPDGLKRMGKTIRLMSRQIPITAAGLANIAAAGGELGIKAPKLPQFVSTTAIMSVAFDMMPDFAGDAAAKLSNVFQIPIEEIGGLGDAMNHLSNNMPAKAREITSALLRVGGNARQFGLSAQQTSALAASFIALGKPPEVAGTAINAMLAKLQTADKQGKKFQSALGEMGTSARELKAAIRDDAEGALSGFMELVAGLDNETRAGILSDLFGMEYADDISLLAGSMDTYRVAMAAVGDETNYAGSMQKEFASRSALTSNKMQLFRNRMNETASAIGEKLLPSLNAAMDRIGGIVERMTAWIEANPKLTEKIVLVVAAIGGLAAILAPVMFGAAVMVTTFSMASLSFTAAALSAGKLMAGFKLLGTAMLANPVAAIIAGIAVGAYLLWENWEPIIAWFGSAWDWVKGKAQDFYTWWSGQDNTITAKINYEESFSGYSGGVEVREAGDTVGRVVKKATSYTEEVGPVDLGNNAGLDAFLSRVDGARRKGGPVRRGGTYLVGEEGPEIVTTGASGTVIPSAASMSLIAALGASPVAASQPAPVFAPVTHVQVDATGMSAGEVRQAVADALRQNEARQLSNYRRALHD